MSTLPEFRLETYFSAWEFKASHHMCASDAQTLRVSDLLLLADDVERERWDDLSLGYGETRGAPPLRDAIASTYEGLGSADVLTFTGAEEGIYCAMRVLLDKTDHAIVLVPSHQSVEALAIDCASAVTGIGLHESNGWQPDLDEIRAALRPNTRVIAVNFPNNPTGVVARSDIFNGIVELCRDRGIYLFSDEVYRGLELDPAVRLPQAAEVYERGVSLNVMSKAYGLPGLRIGWIACRDHDLLSRMQRLKNYLSICNSGPSEVLATIALKAREIIVARNLRRCRINLAKLSIFFTANSRHYEWTEPDGGCVGYARYHGSDAIEEHCRRLVVEAGVLLLPSSLFASSLVPTPSQHFRVGFGRHHIDAGLIAWQGFLDGNEPSGWTLPEHLSRTLAVLDME